MHRVLLAVPQPFYSDRGSPIAVREIVEAYLQLGSRVDLVTFPVGEDCAANGLRIYRARNPFGIQSVPVGFSVRKVLLDFTLSLELWNRLRAGRYGLVHAVEEAAFPAAWLARRFTCALIYDMHSRLSDALRAVPGLGWGPIHLMASRAERWLLRAADVVVTSKGLGPVAQAARPGRPVFEWQFSGALTAGAPEPPEALRARLAIAADARVVLYTGTFSRYQGVQLLLESACEVIRVVPNAVFVLVGAEPGELSTAAATVQALQLEEHARLLPRQPRETIPAYFHLADVLVSPRTGGDNLPLKVFDYLNARRPIVATDIPTHRTVLSESTALLAHPTPAALGAALAAVLADPVLATRLSEGAQAYARSQLGRAAVVEQVRRIVVAATRCPAPAQSAAPGALP